jgi:hypothetical protein
VRPSPATVNNGNSKAWNFGIGIRDKPLQVAECKEAGRGQGGAERDVSSIQHPPRFLRQTLLDIRPAQDDNRER